MLINRPSSPERFIVLVVMLVLLGCSEPEGVATKAAASIVFHTGKVYTVNVSQPRLTDINCIYLAGMKDYAGCCLSRYALRLAAPEQHKHYDEHYKSLW